MSTFTAKYRGTCTECDGSIYPGEEVEFTPSGKLAHAECSDDEKGWTSEVCPKCFLRKSLTGECWCES